MKPTIGRIVNYILSDQDSVEINRRRTTVTKIAERIKKNTEETSAWPLGAQAHIGNEAHAGDIYPMLIVRIWSETCVNGQVFLDGNDSLWATSATFDNGENPVTRTWHWPPRV